MKADYKNWMPKGMVLGTLAVAVVFCIATLIIGITSVVGKIVLVLTALSALLTLWMFLMYRAFSYNGTRQMSKQIIDGVGFCLGAKISRMFRSGNRYLRSAAFLRLYGWQVRLLWLGL